MKFADPYCGIQFSLLPQQKPTASPIRNDMPVKMRMTAICCMVHCLRGFIYDQCMQFRHESCMVLFGKSKENIDTSGHEKFAPFLPLFSDFTDRKTPENLINRTSGVFSSMRITGLEPARRRHQILSLARLPIPPYPHDLKIESKITACRITCSANDPLLDVSYIRSYIIMDEKISGNQFQDIVTK